MASHNRGANPAAPTLPGTLTTTTVDAELLDDEAQWWQLDLNGGADPGTAAANFTVEQCRLSHVDLSQGRWRAAEWRDCVIAHANLANIHAQRCHWQRVSVADARATGLAWTDGVVKDAAFTDCRLDMAGFRFSRLRHVTFTGCRMAGVDFTSAQLTSVRFTDCDLSGAQFHQAKLDNVHIDRCDLEGVGGVESLRGTVVSATDLMPLTLALAEALGIRVELVPPDSGES